MSKAADKKLKEQGQGIVDSLYESSITGSLQSTKLLLELARESGLKAGRVKRAQPSPAARLECEPEWKGARDERDGESDGGPRELEVA